MKGPGLWNLIREDAWRHPEEILLACEDVIRFFG